MRRRAAFVAAVAAASVALLPSAALAHGLGGRLDLPVPIWLFAYGAATVVVVSFVALGVLWKRPRLEPAPEGRPLPQPLQRVLTSRPLEAVVRSLSVATFAVVLLAAAAGSETPLENFGNVFVFTTFWVGLAFAHALFGNWWATLSPWDTVARFLGIGEHPRREYPLAWGMWASAFVLLAFVWFELVYQEWVSSSPRGLAVAIIVYTVVTLAGMAVFGRRAWNEHGEGFAVYFRLLALMAPLARAADGRVVLRTPLAGLSGLRPRPGLVAFVMVVIGSTTFDGFSGTTAWQGWTDELSPLAGAAVATLGLVTAIGLAAGAYALAMLAASGIAATPWHPLAVRFVHSLVPIAFAYVAAHYFSLLVLEGQIGIALASDPLGLGWNLFGTAARAVDYALLSAAAIWYVQVAAIVLGHVAGVVLAHDRALTAFRAAQAVRTQYALLGVMVLFTIGGLVILSGG